MLPIKAVVSAQANAPNIPCAAFSPDPSTGDLILVTIVSYIFSGHTVSDSAGNTYTQVGSTINISGNQFVSLWYCANVASAVSLVVTGHATAGTQARVTAWLIQGAKTSSVYNGDVATKTGTSTTNPSGNPTSPAPSVQSFFLAVMGYSNQTASDGSGWNTVGSWGFTSTMQSDVSNKLAYASNAAKSSVEYKVANAAQTPNWGSAGNLDYAIIAASFAGTGVWTDGLAHFPALSVAM